MGDVPQHALDVFSGAHDLPVIVVLQAHPHAQLGAERGRLPQRRDTARPGGRLVSRLGRTGEDPHLRRLQASRRADPAVGHGNLLVQLLLRSGVGVADRDARDRESAFETRARDVVERAVVVRRQCTGVQIDAVEAEVPGHVEERPDVHGARRERALERER